MSMTVTMPQLGESVTEGTIARWLKHPGDAIAKYESIAEVITDKVNAEIPAPADGVMSELIAAEGAVVPVGQPICSIDVAGAATEAAPAGESVPAPAGPSAPATPQAMSPTQTAQPAAAPTSPAGSGQSTPAPSVSASPEPSQGAPESGEASVAAAVSASLSGPQAPVGPGRETGDAGNGNGAGYHLTPAVRMLVREHGVDLGLITGSGLGGRITKKDVLEYVQQRDADAARTPAEPSAPATPLAMSPTQTAQSAPSAQAGVAPSLPASQPVAAGQAAGQASPVSYQAGEGETVVPLTQVRKAIAEHMVRSRQTSPHAYVMVEVDMSSVSRIREREKAAFEQRHGVKLTFLPFVAQAVVEALQRHPTLNASWSDAGIVVKRSINLGIAVALEDNLIVPVVRDADRLSISGLATTMADLGARARSNHLKLDEIQGGTFTLNNTGALGAVMTQAIINQPQAAIMTMDLVVKRPVVVGDAIAIRPIMNLGLSFDHRINDGLQATRFVTAVQKLLEGIDPSGTLV
jgi:2-oxoisovalerate dehydrogenase E2 component (dihydrolipoyl transacylase)